MTIQEVYDAILASDKLKKAISDAVKNGTVEAFLKSQGCDATQADFEAFLEEKAAKTGKLSDEELKNVAGGFDDPVLNVKYSNIMPWMCIPNYSNETIIFGGKETPFVCA